MLQPEPLIPHDVVSRMVDGATVIRAWREHLGLTLADMAERLGINPSTYALQGASLRLRRVTLERIATALGISQVQLSI